ncbi:histidinol-phosphatase HisJ [Jeotgalibacillus sp. S-D1]|nr:histidinol-phosphatase HisJ [Jeotgalibacillus sp. S-D1]
MRDGHIHSPYCPHGSKDSFTRYIERAIELGYDEISFMEHAPLPKSFTDPTPDKDSGMKMDHLEQYFYDLSDLKKAYKKDLAIQTGLEVDFIKGFETETASFLTEYGKELDDSILSVHFLLKDGIYDCMDFSHQVFKRMITRYGSSDSIHEAYYQTVLDSIMADLGSFKPKRIGHITLARKFQLKYPFAKSHSHLIDAILKAVQETGSELDYNGAGAVKPYCREVYPSEDIVAKAVHMGIPLVYGSDAHQADDLNQGREQLILPSDLS